MGRAPHASPADRTVDFGHSTDLAASHPGNLKELQALFDREARKHNVYPMANNTFELIASPRPKLVAGNTATYTRDTVRIPEDAPIDIKNRSFSLVAEVDNPDGNAEGTLVTLGGETGGFAFLVLRGRPTFLYNWIGRERYTIAASQPLPQGACTIVFDFAYDGGGRGKGGTGTLTVNGTKVGEGRIERPCRSTFSTDDTFDVGEDWGTPVSATYQPPFRFTGTLKAVTVTAR